MSEGDDGHDVHHDGHDVDEEELLDEARRSREETQELRDESGLGRDAEPVDEEPPEDPLPEEADDSEPWATFSAGRDPDE